MDGQTDRQTDGQTDGVTALLDLLSPSATQVKNGDRPSVTLIPSVFGITVSFLETLKIFVK